MYRLGLFLGSNVLQTIDRWTSADVRLAYRRAMALVHDFLTHKTLGKPISTAMENFLRGHNSKLAPCLSLHYTIHIREWENPLEALDIVSITGSHPVKFQTCGEVDIEDIYLKSALAYL